MAYELRFDLKQTGAEALASVDGLIQRLATNTKASAGELKVFEFALRGSIAAGDSLAQALKSIASTTSGGFEGVAKIAKEAQNLGKEASKAADETQKLGRMMELAYNENHARDVKKITDALKEQADAAAKAAKAAKDGEAAANRGASGLLQLASGSGIVTGQLASLTRGAGALSGGLGGIVTPAGLATVGILAIGVAAAKMSYDLVAEFAAAERETSNFADRIGVTLLQAEKLQSQARLTGISINALEQSGRLLGEALENPATTGKKASDALHKLGIETVGLQGEFKETGPIVLELLDKLSRIPDQATRFALANEVLGRGGKAIQPLIADYAELQRIAASLHVGEDAAGSKELLDADRAVKKLDESWTLFKKSLATEIAPITIRVLAKLIPDGHEARDDADMQGLLNGNSNEPGNVAARAQGIARNVKPLIDRDIQGSLDQMRKLGEDALKTSGAAFRASDDKTKESLDEQLKTAKAAADKLRPDLRGDSIDKKTRATETAEYNKQTAEVTRLEAAIKAVADGKKEANRGDEEAIALRSERARLQEGELTGLDAINAKHDALIAKLREEDALYRKEHPGAKPNEKLTPANLAQIDQDTAIEKDKYNQGLAISRAQNDRAVAGTVIDQQKALDKAQGAGGAEIDLARGKSSGQDEAGIEAAYQERLASQRQQFEDAARQVVELRQQRDERQAIKPDTKQLEADNRGITEAQIKATGAAALALYDAQKQRELELIALGKKRFEDEASHARNLRTVTEASTKADIEDNKASLQRRSALIAAQDGKGNDLDTLRKQIDLRRQIAQIDRDEKQRDIEAERAEQQGILKANPGSEKEVDTQLAQLRAQEIANQRGYERELGDERIDIELKIAEIREKDLEKYKRDSESIFDALINRQLGAGHALTLLLRKEALGQGAKLFANATAPILKTAGETLAGAVPASFRPFTKDTIFDPANRAVPGASDATQAATAANTGKTADWLAQIFRAMTGGSAPVASPAAATAPAKLPGILAYARGGGPPVGVPSLVGEEGPELFVPTTPGTILTAADTKRLLASGILAFAEGGGPPVSVLPAGANAPSPAALAIAQALDDNTQATGVLTKSIGQLYSGITGNSPDSSVGSAPAPNSLAGSLAQPVAALPALSPYTASGAGYGMPPGIIDQISGAAPLGTGILATLSTLRAQALSPSGGGGGAVVETGTALASIAKLISGAGGGVSSVVRGDALSNILGGGSGTPGVTVDLLGGEGTGGGGFVSAPTSTAPTPGLVAPLPVSYGGLANPLDGMSVSLPGYTPTTGQQIASGVGLAATIGAGTMGIISGLSQGGPRGDLTAAGSAAGIAGAVVGNVAKLLGAATPLLSAIPIIGSIAAVALPLIGSLFGNGPTQRANQINQELSANQYIAPQALNVTQSSNGNFTDFDARGNIRTSDFSAVPTVRQGFVWEQTHGLFGPPPTYYNVPGGQTSQFNPTTAAPAATIVNHNYAAGAIQAIDTQTFAEAIDKAHVAVGNAAAKNLQNMHGALATEVQRAANG
jgi:hypothetical protein